MRKNIIIFALTAILVVGIGFALLFSGEPEKTKNVTDTVDRSSSERVVEQDADIPEVRQGETSILENSQNNNLEQEKKFSSEEDVVGGPDIVFEEVSYDGNSFQPSSLTIKSGDVVIFRNKSSKPFWPASDPHPEHTLYPEFDSKKPVASGETFELKFTKVGSWGFHNHLNPSSKGIVVVE